jgi:2-hydroxy fatty acid dioxygenase
LLHAKSLFCYYRTVNANPTPREWQCSKTVPVLDLSTKSFPNMTVVTAPKMKGDSLLLPAAPESLNVGFVAAHFFQACIFYYCFKSIVFDFKDAAKSLAFYGVYHREPWNQFIHFFGVPLIIWTMMIFAAHLPFSSQSSRSWIVDGLPGIRRHRVTWATAWVVLYTAFYLSIDVPGALMFAPWLYYMYATSVTWAANDQYRYYYHVKPGQTNWWGTGRLLLLSLLVHASSWILQIHTGHSIIEGATPASLVNLGAALTSAPLFAFYEGIWFLGYRQEFQRGVLEQVAVYTKQVCEQGANLRVCASL